MKVALILPPYSHKIFSENLSTVDEEFCLAPPIILAYIAAILEGHGHKVKLVDARALNLSKEDALKEIKAFKPDMLGFRSETYYFHDALGWIAYLKANLHIPVITGGINLSLYPKETLSHLEIDYAVIGEAIESLPRLIRALEYGDALVDIPGIAYRDQENITITLPIERYVDFDDYPFPARHLLPNEIYYSFISQLKNFTIMVTSTGCPFQCIFCAIPPATKYRTRIPKNVVDEIELCYRDFGIREIDFFDATFFLDKSRMLEIFDGIKKRRLKIEWSARTRVDVVSEDILRQAAKAGCRQVYYGIESANSDVLGAIKKDIKLAQIKDAIKWSKKYGIRTMGFFMVGNPGDTEDSITKTIEFAKKIELDFVQVCRTIAKPGTELNRAVVEKTGKDLWRMHILGEKIQTRLPMPWSQLSQVQIEALTKKFYTRFYFRPIIIWNRMVQLRSFGELKRYIIIGWRMFFQKLEEHSRIFTDVSEAEELLRESSRYLQKARQAKVAIVIPTYNEKENIMRILSAVIEVLPYAHIVIVDDNSTDGTAFIADELARDNPRINVIHRHTKRGLGLAYIDGFKFILDNLDSEFIFEMDADFSHNPRYIPVFLHYAELYRLVTGSRFLRHVSIKNRALWRNVLSIVSKHIVNLLIGMDLTDVATGFKCFRRSVLEDIDFNKIRSIGYAFQIEVSYKSVQKGVVIKEIPIFFEERKEGVSKMSPRIIIEGFFLVLYLMSRRILKRR